MSSGLYLLDTNIVSYLIKNNSKALKNKLNSIDISLISVSAITAAELLGGIKKNPKAIHLKKLVDQFLLRVEVLPWNLRTAESYATLRTVTEQNGLSLGAMDMLIAAHALSTESILVTNDKAFQRFDKFIDIENWVNVE